MNKKFITNTLTIISGTIIGQGLYIIVSPIISRLYTPTDYGIFSYYSSLVTILLVVMNWRYELTIIIPEDDDEGMNLVVLNIFINLFMSIVFIIIILCLKYQIAELLNASYFSNYLIILPLGLFINAFFQTLNYWSTRKGYFKYLSIKQINQGITTSFAQIGSSVCVGTSPWGLIWGSIIGQISSTFILFIQLLNKSKKIVKIIDLSVYSALLKKYKRYPQFLIIGAFLNNFSLLMPIFILGFFFSPDVVGCFSFGQKIVSIPLGIVGGAVAQVFLPTAEENRRNGFLDDLVYNVFIKLVIIGTLPIFILGIIGQELVIIVFGEKWALAGIYLQILTPSIFFGFIAGSISSIFVILNKQHVFLYYNIIFTVLGLLVLIVGGIIDNDIFSIILYGAIGSIIYFVMIIHLLKFANVKILKVCSEVLKTGFASIIMSTPVIIVKIMKSSSIYLIIACVIVGCIYCIKIYNKIIKRLL